jgi:membrane fusion protein, multidrug efflux system
MKYLRRIPRWLLLLCVPFVLVVVRLWPSTAPTAGGGRSAEPVPVKVTFVRTESLADEVISTGTLRAFESVELQVETAGKLVTVGFAEGTVVKKGTLLLQVDDAELRAELTRAERRRDLALLREQRLAPLVAGGGISESQYDEASSEVAILNADIEAIRQQLSRRAVRAPFDGVVGLRFVSEGAYVTPATRIATLQQLDKLKLDFNLPERYGTVVAAGQRATFSVSGMDTVFEAEIYAVEPRVDETTRTLLVRAWAANPHGNLRPGSFARVTWFPGGTESGILIPSVAVVPGRDGDAVFLVVDGKIVRRRVTSGPRVAGRTRVITGLADGDAVVVAGTQLVRPGTAVRVID